MSRTTVGHVTKETSRPNVYIRPELGTIEARHRAYKSITDGGRRFNGSSPLTALHFRCLLTHFNSTHYLRTGKACHFAPNRLQKGKLIWPPHLGCSRKVVIPLWMALAFHRFGHCWRKDDRLLFVFTFSGKYDISVDRLAPQVPAFFCTCSSSGALFSQNLKSDHTSYWWQLQTFMIENKFCSWSCP